MKIINKIFLKLSPFLLLLIYSSCLPKESFLSSPEASEKGKSQPEKKKSAIGFDFDGVLHLSVSRADSFGQVHPDFSLNFYELRVNGQIVEIMKDFIKEGKRIYIITHRGGFETKEFILNYLEHHGVVVKKENIFYARDLVGGSKGFKIKELEIEIFYEDSPKVLKEIHKTAPQVKLYQVFPTAYEEDGMVKDVKIQFYRE